MLLKVDEARAPTHTVITPSVGAGSSLSISWRCYGFKPSNSVALLWLRDFEYGGVAMVTHAAVVRPFGRGYWGSLAVWEDPAKREAGCSGQCKHADDILDEIGDRERLRPRGPACDRACNTLSNPTSNADENSQVDESSTMKS
jgi:hypothetical protein